MEKQIIHIKVGAKYTIELKGSGTTGYQWVAFPEKNSFFTSQKTYSSKGIKRDLLGASANEVFTITTLQKGTTTLQLKQIKTWEKNPVAAKEINFSIIIE